MEKNILGVDLNIDQEYIANCVKDVVKASMSEALGTTERITSEVINEILKTKVDKSNGKIRDSDWNTEPILDHYLKEEIIEIVKKELKLTISNKRDVIRKLIRKELQEKNNLEKFVDSFINNTAKAVENQWQTNINIDFTKQTDD